MKKLQTKKYLIVGLIPIILALTLIPLFEVLAEEENTENKLAGLDFVAGWFGDGVLDLVSKLTAIMGIFMEAAINYSIINTEFYDMDTVRAGWAVCRDLANMFFIFILLYIGLSMILQLSGVNTKKMLISVIIIALLVNFSFPFTRIIIDATNLFAMEFLCALTDDQCNAALISNVFSNGLQTHTIHKNAEATGAIKIAFTTLLGSVFLIIAAFIFLAIAIVFVVRTVVLLMLLIFSPLAYLAMILPATAGFARKWWEQLLKQAITAPAIMFMLYLTGMMIHFGLPGVLETQTLSFWTILTNPTQALRGGINIVLQFFIVCAMLVGSIMVAQNIGAYGASGAISFAHGVRKRATGYAGRINRRYGTGKVADKAVSTKQAQALARIPVLGKAIRPLAKAAESRRADYAKQSGMYTKMAPRELAVTLPGLAPEIRKSVTTQMDDEKMAKMAKTMTASGQISFGKKLYKQDKQLGKKFAVATRDLSTAGKIIQQGENMEDNKESYKEAVSQAHDSMNINQLKDLNLKKLGQDKDAMEVFLDKTSTKNLEQITSASRENIKDMSDAIKSYSGVEIKKDKPLGQAEKIQVETKVINSMQKHENANKFFTGNMGSKVVLEPEKVVIEREKGEKKSLSKEDVKKIAKEEKTKPGE